MKKIDITFKNMKDFQSRIATLWQNQKEDEIYNFIFLNDDSEKSFEMLCKSFAEGQ